MENTNITSFTSNLMGCFGPENRSHSHSYAPSFHVQNNPMRLDSGFNICF